MRTTDPDMSTEHCGTLRRLIAEKREKIEEIERIIEVMSVPAEVGQIEIGRQRLLVDAKRNLDIAQRELEDLLNDFDFSDCHRPFSLSP